jgi:hypothetical protein
LALKEVADTTASHSSVVQKLEKRVTGRSSILSHKARTLNPASTLDAKIIQQAASSHIELA